MPSSYSRREFIHVVGAAAAMAAMPGSLGFAQSPGGKKKNVLFIAVDDLRPQLGCYGHKQMKSPHMDRLAREGVVFNRAYCQVPICGASRSSLLSGVRPDTTGIYYLKPSLREAMPDVLTLPQHFKNNGYHTTSLSKIYHDGNDDPQGWTDKHWHPAGAWPGYANPENLAIIDYRKKVGERAQGPAIESADVPDNAYYDGKTADHAVESLNRLKDETFFLAVGFYRPHLPFIAPKKYWDMYPPESIDLADNPFKPKDCPDIAMHNWGELRNYYGIPSDGPVSDDLARHLIRGYYASTSYADAQVGRLLDELDRLGLADDTVVVVWGDHGWSLGEHGLWAKHANFETCVHSPLIVRVPGMAGNGQSTDGLVEFIDIYPSLADLCGLPIPEHCQGRSFAELLESPSRAGKEAAYSQYPRGQVMGYTMRTDRYRYTEWIHSETHVTEARELYDHETDPGENVSLASRPGQEALVASLSQQLRSDLNIPAPQGAAQ